MSERILNEISKDFIGRMREWALGREVSVVQSSWPSDGPGAGIGNGASFHNTRLPQMLGRVHDTEMAIATLPARYKGAVRQFWMYEGRSLRWHGRMRGIDRATFETWVMKGHVFLAAEFGAKAGGWQRMRKAAREQRVRPHHE